MKIFYSLFFAMFLLNGIVLPVPHQIVIIRHGEKISKTNVSPYLSERGIIRSLQLPHYFKNNFPVPAAIFAQGIENETNSLRPVQTMAPTACYYAALYPKNAAQFTIITKYFAQQVNALAAFILQNSSYNNQTIFICWCHDELQQLAKALGVENAPAWPGGIYGQTWVIKFDQGTKEVKSFKIKEQEVNFPKSGEFFCVPSGSLTPNNSTCLEG